MSWQLRIECGVFTDGEELTGHSWGWLGVTTDRKTVGGGRWTEEGVDTHGRQWSAKVRNTR